MGKRLFDVIVSSGALILFGPMLFILAACLIASSGRPVFYKGWRAGRGGMPFRILKLRTMIRDAELKGGSETPSDDPRIIGMGWFLRKYKLDEVPQFVNVLIGDMSIVGPRPEVMEEIRMYGLRERGLLAVRPGITDWASVKFRHEDELLRGASDPHDAYHRLIQPDKVRLGLKYAGSRSMGVDLSIILETAVALVKGRP